MSYTYSMMTTMEDTPDVVIAKLREMYERAKRENEQYVISDCIFEFGKEFFHKIFGELPYIDHATQTIFGIAFNVGSPRFIDPRQARLIIKDIQRTERIDYTSLYNKTSYYGRPKIKDVIFNDPATIVIWTDGTKTVVKAENEDYDPEKGLAMCIAKKFLGNKGNYYDIFRKLLPNE